VGIYDHLTIRPGETLLSRCCGGGGYGDPHTREPERVLADVKEGLVSRERAAAVYGVILDEELELDLAATVRARAALSEVTEVPS
jgi:N-methylhydantoinase B